ATATITTGTAQGDLIVTLAAATGYAVSASNASVTVDVDAAALAASPTLDPVDLTTDSRAASDFQTRGHPSTTTDNVTNDPTPDFRAGPNFRTDAEVVFTATSSSQTPVSVTVSVTGAASGTNLASVTFPELADGVWNVVAVQTVSGMATSAPPAALAVTIDATLPVVTLGLNPDHATPAASKSYSATVDAGGSPVTMFWRGQAGNSCPGTSTGIAAYTSGEALVRNMSTDGGYICFYAVDLAGNRGDIVVTNQIGNIDPSLGGGTTLPTVTIDGDSTTVEEGADAVFTITTDTAPSGATLVVNVGTSQDGTFFSGTPPTAVTIADGATTAKLTIATDDDSNDESDGSITATITANAAYTVGTDASDTIAVTDNDGAAAVLPEVSLDFIGLASQSKTCEAAATTRAANEGGKDGICEGDAIVYILTSDTAAPAGGLAVKLGTLEAGRPQSSALVYGLTSPYNGYVSGADENRVPTLTIPVGETEIRYTIATANQYGDENIGAMYVEIVCVTGDTCVADGTGDYTYSRADRGQTAAPAAAGNTSNCSPNRQAMSDGNEDGECLVDIHPVLAPVMTVAADVSTVATSGVVTFTITADKMSNNYNADRTARAPLTINIAVSERSGQTPVALAGAPTIATMGASDTTATIMVTAGAADSDLVLALAAGTGYSVTTTEADASATVTVGTGAPPPVLPNVSISYAGKADGSRFCVDSSLATKAGVCEGDAIIYTISADPAPTSNMAVQLGQLATNAATNTDHLDYGLADPNHNYVIAPNHNMPATVTIPANAASITHEVRLGNGYGTEPHGGHYIEVICVDTSGGNTGCLTDDTIDTEYTFAATTRGGADGTALTPVQSNCTVGAGGSGDESSECFVHIHPVTAPEISVVAADASVPEGTNALFSVIANKAPNNYNSGRTARIAQAISFAVTTAGDSLSAPPPTSIDLPANGDDVTVSLGTQAGDSGAGSVTLTLSASGNRYSINTDDDAATISVTVAAANPSPVPTVDLHMDSDSRPSTFYGGTGVGTSNDNITRESAWMIVVGGLDAAGGDVRVMATHATRDPISMTGTATSTNITVALPAHAEDGTDDGLWNVVATYTQSGMDPTDSAPLMVTYDRTPPTLTIVAPDTSLALFKVASATSIDGPGSRTRMFFRSQMGGAACDIIFNFSGRQAYTAGTDLVFSDTDENGIRACFHAVDPAGNIVGHGAEGETGVGPVIMGITTASPGLDVVDLTTDSQAAFQFKNAGHPSSDNDNVTNDNTPDFRVGPNFRTDAEVVFTATSSGQAPVSATVSVTAAASGTNLAIVTFPELADGDWDVVAVQTVAGMLASVPPAPLRVTIDTTRPIITLVDNPDAATPAVSKTYSATASTGGSPVQMWFRGQNDANCPTTPNNQGGGVAPYTSGEGLVRTANAGYICFIAVDLAGNAAEFQVTNQIINIDPTLTAAEVTIAADSPSVVEGADAIFTITTDTPPSGATLVVNVGTSEDGTFIDGTPPSSVTIADGETTAKLTVATDDDGNEEPAGSITATVNAGNGYTPGSASSASIAVTDNDGTSVPTVTLDFEGLASGTKTCEASARTDKRGICEGDAIVFILTADSAPSANLVVGIGRLEAGDSGSGAGRLDYGLPVDSYNEYVDPDEDAGPGHTITILAGEATARYTITTTNRYGNDNVGGMYYELVGTPTDYQFNSEDRGQFNAPTASGANPTNCPTDADAMSDNNEDSECLVVIHPVAAPELSVSTTTTSAEFGDMVTFTITGDEEPNNYNADRTARAALPVTIAITQGGSTLAGAVTTVDMGASATTTTVEVTAGAMAIGSPLNLAVVASTATPPPYSVSSTNPSAAVALTADANASTPPTVDLATASDTHNTTVSLGAPGTDSDDITKNRTPTITVTNVVNGGEVVVMATHASATAVSVTGTAAGVSIDLALPTLVDGVWMVTATHEESGKSAATSAALPITIDRTDPVVTIVDPGTAPAMSKTFVATDDKAAGYTVMKLRSQNTDACPTFPPTGGTADYVEGADHVVTSEGENGNYVCFYSTDLADNRSRRAILVGGIDTTAPTVSFTPDPAFVDTGATVVITVTTNEATTDLIAADITTSLGTLAGFTANSSTEYVVTLTAPAAAGMATLTIAADAFTDAAGNGNTAATHTVTVQAAGDPQISIVNAAQVDEGSDAVFTISSNKAAAAELVIGLAVTNVSGMFLDMSSLPTAVTIPAGGSMAMLTIPTLVVATTALADGTIAVTLNTGTGYDLVPSLNIGLVTVRDLPLITLSYASKADGGRTCDASGETNKDGVCEGDIIVYTITATPTPTSNLPVRLGRLEAGNFSINYGLTSPGDYVANNNDRTNETVTILANTPSITHEIQTNNLYDTMDQSGYFVEVVCVNQNPQQPSTECLTNDALAKDYIFEAATRGNQSGQLTPAQANCDGGSGGDGDESSECFVHIHPVTPPAISITAVSSSVTAGAVASFALAGTVEPNYYSGGIRAAVPVSVTIMQGGTSLANAPATLSMGASDTTANVFIVSGADAGQLEVTITNANGYSVGTPASASVAVTAAPADAADAPDPVDLVDASDSLADAVIGVGTNSDNITNDNTPEFTVSGVTGGASVVVTATHATAAAVSATGMVGSGDASVDITLPMLADGVWSVTATQTGAGSISPASTALPVTIDASVPVITLGLNPSAAAEQLTYSATATGGDAGGTALTMHYRLRADNACDYGAPGANAYTAYTPGSNLVINSVTDDTDFICFYATDEAGSSVFAVTNQVMIQADLPTVSLDFVALANGDKTCAASAEANKAGVCEGDAIVFIISSDEMAPAGGLEVILRALEAGRLNNLDYGLTNPGDYLASDSVPNQTIAAGQTEVRYTLDTRNHYGTRTIGAMYLEIQASSAYDRNALDRGHDSGNSAHQPTAIGLTSNCGRAALSDGNEDSECLVGIHPVAAPTISVAAGVTTALAGVPVTFTLTGTRAPNNYNADRTARAALPINITVTQGGTALTGVTPPATVDFPVNGDPVDVIIATDDTIGDLVLALATGTGYSVTTTAADASATVPLTGDTRPLVTISYAGQASGNQMCAASTATNKGGVCEGDGIVFTITSSAPAPSGGLEVRLGRLPAGQLNVPALGDFDYELPLSAPANDPAATPARPYADYVSGTLGAGRGAAAVLTIPAGQMSASYTVPTDNQYGAQTSGAYYNEIICRNNVAPGAAANACVTDGIGEYRFNGIDRSQFEASNLPNTSNCGTRAAGSDGNENSECLVDIHSIALPALSVAVAGDVTTVAPEGTVSFVITGTSVPNRYDDATAGPAMPITFGVTQAGVPLSPLPTVTMGTGETTATATITTGTAAGNLVLTLTAATGYSVDTASASVFVGTAGAPRIDLQAASDTGNDMDNSTTINTPTFDITGLTNGASAEVTASFGGNVIQFQKLFTATGASETVGFGNPGAGPSTCRIIEGGTITGSAEALCTLERTPGGGDSEGTWVITASQTPPGGSSVAADPLNLIIDTTAPTVALTSEDSSVITGETTTITITVTDASPTDFELADITISDSSTLSNLELIPGTNDFTVTFTAGSTGTSELSVAAGAFTDGAGNASTAASATLALTIDPVELTSLPVVSVSYAGKFSGDQTCDASSETNKAGVCEGDTIVFTITSSQPAPAGGLAVRLGRLAAGLFGIFYGIPGTADDNDNTDDNPTNYAPSGMDRTNHTVTIPATMMSVTHEIPLGNEYGSGTLGGYYLEVVCVNQNSGQPTTECLTDGGTLGTEYTFVATTRTHTGSDAQLTPAASNCDGGAGGDGDESSECFVHIHPVTAPVVSMAAVSTGPVAEGTAAEFSITADKVPNHYNADRTALAALPITIEIDEVGEVTSVSSPITVDIPAAGSTANFSVATDTDTTGWDGTSSAVSATVVDSPDTPVRYTPHSANDGAEVMVTDDDTVTIAMGADPANATEGGDLEFTVAVTAGELQADLVLAYDTAFTFTGTATSADYTAPTGSLTITAGTSSAAFTITTLVDAVSDNGETIIITLGTVPDGVMVDSANDSATGTIDDGAPLTVTIADADSVAESRDATFTITASTNVGADLTVMLAAANANPTGGMFLGANPPTMAVITSGTDSVDITVPTVESGDGVTGIDGVITVTLADGADYDPGTTSVASVVVQDVPTITIDWDSKARPGVKTCDAARSTEKSGVCEGDTVIFTITATPTPAVDTAVRLGRCSAGGCDPLGLTSPYSYNTQAHNSILETIPAGASSITYDRVMSNQYGNENDGGYIVEVVCRNGNIGQANCPATTIGSSSGGLSIEAPHRAYRFTDTAESPAVGPNDNDDSESFADVRSVALTVSVAAASPAVTEGNNAVFTVTGSNAPNHYDANGALAGQPISITVGESGDTIADAPFVAPTMVTMAVGASTVAVPIETKAGDGERNVTLTIGANTDSPVRYTVGTASVATVSVIDPVQGLPVITINDATAVDEGSNAIFTVSADSAVSADLEITLVAANSSGTFLAPGAPTMATIATGDASTMITVATMTNSGATTIANGVI
ncbi:MAG: Ig-like domain-containing protein, partial [Pseudohongiellaceae bacterium]